MSREAYVADIKGVSISKSNMMIRVYQINNLMFLILV